MVDQIHECHDANAPEEFIAHENEVMSTDRLHEYLGDHIPEYHVENSLEEFIVYENEVRCEKLYACRCVNKGIDVRK